MGRLSAFLIALALAATATLGLSACGSSGGADLLPGETADEIKSNIDQVEQLVSEGDCVGAEDATAAISGQVESLSGVDAKLKQALSEGAGRLNEVVAECEEEAGEETLEALEPSEEEIEAEEREREEEEKEKEKPEKEKPEKEKEEPAEGEGEGPTLPPQSNGKGEENGKGNGPPVEPESPSGGVGPGVAAGEE